MKFFYNVTGTERKKLVAAISQELNAPNKYLGAPIMPRNPICEEYG